MTPNSNSVEIFVHCTYPQVSSSYVHSFGSYRVDKQTDPPENIPALFATLQRWVMNESLQWANGTLAVVVMSHSCWRSWVWTASTVAVRKWMVNSTTWSPLMVNPVPSAAISTSVLQEPQLERGCSEQWKVPWMAVWTYHTSQWIVFVLILDSWFTQIMEICGN